MSGRSSLHPVCCPLQPSAHFFACPVQKPGWKKSDIREKRGILTGVRPPVRSPTTSTCNAILAGKAIFHVVSSGPAERKRRVLLLRPETLRMVGGKCGSRRGEQTWGGSSFWRFDSVVLSSARGPKRKLECTGACSIWPIEYRKGRAERSRIMGSSWKQTISVTRPCRSNLRSFESCLALPLPTLAGGSQLLPRFRPLP